jgi:peptidyl-prolyl cis-trans isomerase C
VLKTTGFWCALVAACVLLWGCGGKEEAVLARVNGSELTLDDLYAEIPEYYWGTITQEQKLQFLERWINGELLYQEALRRGLQRSATIKERVRAAEKSILIAELIQQELIERVQITEEETREYYLAHQDDFTRKADEVRASQILVATLDEARRIRAEIEAGGDFPRLAQKYSVDPTAEQGGDLGYFSREDVLQEVAKAAFSLSPGAISQPVKSEFGYHLITVTDIKKKGSVRSLDLVKEEIIGQFTAKKDLEELNLFLEELKGKGRIKQNLELLRWASPPGESSSVPPEENL